MDVRLFSNNLFQASLMIDFNANISTFRHSNWACFEDCTWKHRSKASCLISRVTTCSNEINNGCNKKALSSTYSTPFRSNLIFLSRIQALRCKKRNSGVRYKIDIVLTAKSCHDADIYGRGDMVYLDGIVYMYSGCKM